MSPKDAPGTMRRIWRPIVLSFALMVNAPIDTPVTTTLLLTLLAWWTGFEFAAAFLGWVIRRP